MSLQRINRLFLRDVRSWRGENEFIFENEISVLYGPNGTGKSSLWTAIVLGLLYKSRGGIGEKIRPIGEGAGNPYIEVDFISNGVRYRIEKLFAKGKAATARLLELDSGNVLSEDDEATIECRNLLSGNNDRDILSNRSSGGGAVGKAIQAAKSGLIIDVTLPKQGQLNSQPESNESLMKVGLDTSASANNSILNSLISWVEKEKKLIRSSKNTTATGKLMDATSELEIVKQQENDLNEISNSLKKLFRELIQLEIEEGVEETVEGKEKEIERLQEESEKHKILREDAEKKSREIENQLKPIEDSHNQREKLNKEYTKLKDQKIRISSKMEVMEDDVKTSHVDLDMRKSETKTVNKELDGLNEWVTFLQRKEGADAKNEELKRLKNDDDLLNQLIDNKTQIAQELGDIQLATSKQWERIRTIPVEIAAIIGAKDAWTITNFSPGKEHKILIDNEEIKKEPESVNTSIEVRKSNNKTIIRMENKSSLSKIKELEEELNVIYSALKVKGSKELRERQVNADTLKGSLRDETIRLEDLTNTMPMEERVEKIAALKARLESKISKPKSKRPAIEEGDWSDRMIQLEGKKKSAVDLEDEARIKMQKSRDKFEGIKGQYKENLAQYNEKDTELKDHISLHGDDDSLKENLHLLRNELQKAKAIEKPLLDSRSANEEQKLIQARNLQDEISGNRDIRTRIIQIETTIKDRRVNGGLDQLVRVESKRQGFEDEVKFQEIDFLAHKALEEALKTVRAANIKQIRPRIERTIQQGASYVFNNADLTINLGDDGFPEAVQHIQGQKIKFEEESFGTQEQLNLIYRIALAEIIADDEGHGLCIVIDDPFGNTDVGRRRRMIHWMGAQLEKSNHQLILLTCRGSDFQGFGSHIDIRNMN
jgi:energy-coupling factor transporter ATP-binding protein EcfA2